MYYCDEKWAGKIFYFSPVFQWFLYTFFFYLLRNDNLFRIFVVLVVTISFWQYRINAFEIYKCRINGGYVKS